MALNFSFSPERMKDRKREIERERERERKKENNFDGFISILQTVIFLLRLV